MLIKQALKNLGGEISKNSPVLFTGIAVSGVLATAIFAVKATPKAVRILEQEAHRRDYLREEETITPITKLDVIKLTWKEYIPATVCATMTITCILALNSVHNRRTAALASIYSITETAFQEYQNKVVETIGKNKELAVRDEISKDHIRKNPSSRSEVIITGKGDILCYDTLSGRYFKSDIDKIRRVINELNRDLMTAMWLSLNELYSEVGLPSTKLGEDVGWNIDNGLIDISFSTQLNEDEIPCLVLNYVCAPKWYDMGH